MTLHAALIVAASSYLMVCARAFQQLNVMHHRLLWVAPISAVMAVMEVCIVLNVVATGWWAIVLFALGGSTGCMSAMLLHARMRGRQQ